ncbi:MAG TPA: 2-C-methyl-D-erythritol 2,4-cyclodiphosphate synthase [Spirochaetota bacterium]|nr:2-C-methyl-D-erythritol 2,4-cyclodiphosphate synthase [Spirochaetota bacterium]
MKCAIGQDSHAFSFTDKQKKLVLGGVEIKKAPPLQGNSDADVILHALTNAVSGITGSNILGKPADKMCREENIKDSSVFLQQALSALNKKYSITHVSVAVEAKQPVLASYIDKIKKNLGRLLGISPDCVGLTASSGEGLTAFGKGLGIQAFCIITVNEVETAF